MEHISKNLTVSRNRPNGSDSGSRAAPDDAVRRRAAAVWQGMKQLYGVSFMTIQGEVPSALWVAEIAKLSDAECREGLGRLAGEKRQYPANLTEFVAACKPPKSVRYLGAPTTPAGLRRLEAPRANREKVERHLANMRRALGVEKA